MKSRREDAQRRPAARGVVAGCPCPRPFGRAVGIALSCVVGLALTVQSSSAQEQFDEVERIVAVGDVHGGYDAFVGILRAAGVIDLRNRWIGGRTHLVQTGDILDRGPGSRKALDLLMDLEQQAPEAGGRVHALLGNHEVMNIIGDLRYVSEEEYDAFRTSDSAEVRDRAFDLLADPERRSSRRSRRRWDRRRPLGWVEHRAAFGPDGKYGEWLRQRHTIVRVGGILFLHGGLSPEVSGMTLSEINERVRSELAESTVRRRSFSMNPDGPFWYRGLALEREADLAAHVDRLLETYAASHIVVGHTAVARAIVPRFAGKVIAIDVELSEVYGGPPACLIIEDGRLFALHRGQRLELPQDGNLRPYLEKVAAADPAPSPILSVIDRLAPETSTPRPSP